MIYACVYPEKFEGDKASKLMQVATEFQFLDLYRYTIFVYFHRGESIRKKKTKTKTNAADEVNLDQWLLWFLKLIN